ncbi:MAG: hypothetical protein PHP00_07235 [Thiotrichaceae bacterium]|nr:hypothetical protein [Thiotrichaceae bacterium]
MMDDRLVEAVAACLKTSSTEELREVINFYPELLTEDNNIEDLFKYFLLIAEEQSEKQVMIVKQHYLALKDEVIFSLEQQFKLLKNNYITTGNSKYLYEALHVLEKALKHPRLQTMNPEFELDRLTDCSEIYLRLYLETGLLEYLNTGIDIVNSVIEQSQDLSNLPTRLNNLALGLNYRYSHLGAIPDLEMVIDTFKKAINIAENSVSESNRLPVLYNNYAKALRERYLLFKNLQDLNDSINTLIDAIADTPDDAESDLIERLLNLGLSLIDRYSSSEQITDLTDLEEGVEKLKQSLTLAKKHEQVVILQNLHNALGHGLLTFFNRSQNIEDLKEAIEQFKQAIAKNSTDSPKSLQYFSNLGVAFRQYYSDSQNPAHLQQGIDAFRKAVKLGENYSV